MRPKFGLGVLLGVALSVPCASAQAQLYYPGGYGGYGWGGWGGGGQTPQGDYARGMGVFAAGAGYYNKETAIANSINANTAMNWNEYWYQSQQQVNRHYYAKLAARQKENVKTHDDMYKRLRDNPNKYDIYRGDALNVIFDELSNPKVYMRGLKSASIKFPGEMIRDVPFQYASAAITATVHSITTKGSAPDVLKRPVFKEDMAKLREVGGQIRSEDEKDGKIDPETLDKAQSVLEALQAKVNANLEKNSHDWNEADRFVRAAMGFTRMLRTPAINVLLADVDKHPETTVGDLLSFMKAFNLRFGAADDPREKMVYDELYPILLKLRDDAFPDRRPEMASASPDVPPPTEFFAKMETKAVAPKDAPPPPVPAPSPR